MSNVEGTVFGGPISRLSSSHFCRILFIDNKSLGPAHPQKEGTIQDMWYAYHILQHLQHFLNNKKSIFRHYLSNMEIF